MAMWISALSVLFLAAVAASVVRGDENECVYTVYVRTGSVIKGGTDAKISLSLQDASGKGIVISDLESWGGLIMGSDHDFFERGALDVFSGRGPCGLNPPLCKLNLTSDGSGSHHGWFCEYVEVTTTGPHVPCAKTLFYVNQWLALDAPPYQLNAIVDGCAQPSAAHGAGYYDHHQRRLVIGEQSSASSM